MRTSFAIPPKEQSTIFLANQQHLSLFRQVSTSTPRPVIFSVLSHPYQIKRKSGFQLLKTNILYSPTISWRRIYISFQGSSEFLFHFRSLFPYILLSLALLRFLFFFFLLASVPRNLYTSKYIEGSKKIKVKRDHGTVQENCWKWTMNDMHEFKTRKQKQGMNKSFSIFFTALPSHL